MLARVLLAMVVVGMSVGTVRAQAVDELTRLQAEVRLLKDELTKKNREILELEKQLDTLRAGSTAAPSAGQAPDKVKAKADPTIDVPLQFTDLETIVRRICDSKSPSKSPSAPRKSGGITPDELNEMDRKAREYQEKQIAIALTRLIGKRIVLVGVVDKVPLPVKGVAEVVLQYESKDTVRVMTVAGRSTLTGDTISRSQYSDEPRNRMTIKVMLNEQQLGGVRHKEQVEVNGTIKKIYAAPVSYSGQLSLQVELKVDEVNPSKKN
jgi:hypothetical protein